MRKEIWDFVESSPYKDSLERDLIDLAKDIASSSEPTQINSVGKPTNAKKKCHVCFDNKCQSPSRTCPNPINYLVNGEMPTGSAPMGLAGHLGPTDSVKGSLTCLSHPPVPSLIFNGCNFDNLLPLAIAKGASAPPNSPNAQLRGFNIPGTNAGLSILLGPWSDFCLWCWTQPQSPDKEVQPIREVQPILILGKDNSPFAEEQAISDSDWGVDQVNQIINSTAEDPSSKNLFDSIRNVANNHFQNNNDGNLIRYIGVKRIFIYNVWPWFRCGQKSTGNDGIHSDFSKVPCLESWLSMLIGCLRPKKIAALGGWAYDDAPSQLLQDISATTPRKNSWFIREFLKGTSFKSCTAADPNIRQFYHPSMAWNKQPRWFSAIPAYNSLTNKAAFEDFLT